VIEATQELTIEEAFNQVTQLKSSIASVLIGQDTIIENVLTVLFSGGHILLEGVPGLGKTLLVRALAQSLSVDFSRVQFS